MTTLWDASTDAEATEATTGPEPGDDADAGEAVRAAGSRDAAPGGSQRSGSDDGSADSPPDEGTSQGTELEDAPNDDPTEDATSAEVDPEDGFSGEEDSEDGISGEEDTDHGTTEEVGLDPAELRDELARLRGEVEAAKEEAATHLERLQRVQADFLNYKKRKRREQEVVRTRAEDDVVRRVLPVMDNLQRAAERDGGELGEGLRLIHRQLRDILDALDVERVDEAGVPFDPEVHEALIREATGEGDPDEVLEVLEPGYLRGERVLRAAKVKVAAPPEDDR